jgi:hypothetical protein
LSESFDRSACREVKTSQGLFFDEPSRQYDLAEEIRFSTHTFFFHRLAQFYKGTKREALSKPKSKVRMKKMTLFIASVLFAGVTALYAQAPDTTATAQGPQDKNTVALSNDTESNSYTRDMILIQVSDIPAALRSKLQGSIYKGWENGTIYRSKSYEGYVVEINDGTKIKTFRFDANGKPIRE